MRRLILAPLALVPLVACGDGGGSVPEADVEEAVREQLTEEVGQEPAAIECPDDLEAEVGTEMRCELTADDGTRIGLTVTVSSVDGDNVRFDIARTRSRCPRHLRMLRVTRTVR